MAHGRQKGSSGAASNCQNGTTSLGVKQALWSMQSLTVLHMIAIRSTLASINAEHDRPMWKVYGLDKTLCEKTYIDDFHFRKCDLIVQEYSI